MKSILLGLWLVISFLFMTSCQQSEAKYVKSSGEMLGTFMQVTALSEVGVDEIYERMMSLDKEAKASMSIFDRESLLSRVNRNETDSLDEHIIYCLNLAREVTRTSGGFYDVTVAPLVEAYGFAGKERVKSVNVDSLMEFVGIDKLSVQGNRLVKSDPRVRIDFNSIAKGYVVDMAARALENMGIKEYLVDIGGEVRCQGRNPKGGAWRVGIETPYDGNNTPGESIQQVISLTDCAMATSGNYRRFYLDEQGNKVAHTIDPRTGKSAVTDLLSATVIAPTCAEADAYGTMFMAMGTQRAIELAKELAKESVMVYFISSGEDDSYEIYYSAALAPMLKNVEGYNVIK